MTHVGILVTARPINGGTFHYTLSMIEALCRLREHKFTIYSPNEMDALTHLGLPIVRLPGLKEAYLRALGGGV